MIKPHLPTTPTHTINPILVVCATKHFPTEEASDELRDTHR